MGSTALSGGLNNEGGRILPSSGVASLKESADVKQRSKELPCIGSLFGEINWNTSGSTINSLKNENTEGCLTIWWEKETYENWNWRGSWSLLLGMRDNEYGFVFSQNVKTENGKLIFDSSFYNLNNKNGWSLVSSDVYKNGNKKEIELMGSDGKILLPKDETIKQSELWSFGFNMGHVCSETNKCEGSTPINKRSSSIWNFVPESKNGGSELAHKWFENIEKFGHDAEIRLLHVKGSFKLTN